MAEVESKMVVVVEDTWMVEVERCCGKGGGLVACTRVTASKASVAACGSCHRAPMWMRQTASLDEEVHGIEVLALGYGEEAGALEFETEIDQVAMRGCPG